jgi:hypothetical protein
MKRRTLTRDDLLQSGNLSKGQQERHERAALREVDAAAAKAAKIDREAALGPHIISGADFVAMERGDLEPRSGVVGLNPRVSETDDGPGTHGTAEPRPVLHQRPPPFQ